MANHVMPAIGHSRLSTRAPWDAWKRAHGVFGSGSVRRLPGFASGLAALHADGWSQSDIARMFGVSRERVHQWFSLCGLVPRFWGSRNRVWSAEAQRFVPVAEEPDIRAHPECDRLP